MRHRPGFPRLLGALLAAAALSVGGAGAAFAASPGTLDPSFASGGTFLQQFGAGSSGPYSEAWDVTSQPDGKVVFVGEANSTGSPAQNQLLVGRLNPDGTPDPSFASGGRLIDQLGVGSTPFSLAQGVVVQPDGKIVFAGYASDISGHTEVLVGRLNAEGSFDSSFGSGGVFLDQLGTGTTARSQVNFGSILLQGGNIVLGGQVKQTGTGDQAMVLRLTSSGTLDSSFGTAGVLLHQFGSGTGATSRVTSLAAQADGKLLIGGDAGDGSQTKVVVARLNPSDGSFDTAFGSGGAVVRQLGSGATNPSSHVYGVAQRPDGRIITEGDLSDGSGDGLAMLAQFNADGSLDTSFGSSGVASTQFGTSYTFGNPPTTIQPYSYNFGLALQPNGKIVTNVVADGGTFAPKVARFNSDGSLDQSFGNGGVVETAQPAGPHPGSADGDGLALQSDGKILDVGEVPDAGGNGQVFVSRVIGDLAPIASFRSSPTPAEARQPESFNGGGSSDPDGTIASYKWDFGDGASGSGATTTHAYAAPGTYMVKLVVTDDDALTATTTRTITVATVPPPRLTHVFQAARRWRAGRALPQIARKRRPRVGTRFGFTLNESARVTLAFTQRLPGRKAGRRCVAQSRSNRAKRRCTRTVIAGTLRFTGHTGANTVRFAGHLSRRRRLKPGFYTLVITATNTAGKRASAKLKFRIVKA